jgi:hypothetical protein
VNGWSRVESNFAGRHGIGSPEVQRVVAQVREATRAAEAAKPTDDGWEFRIAVEGEEGFILMLAGMDSSGEFNEQTAGKMMAQAGKYGVAPERAVRTQHKESKDAFEKLRRDGYT